MEYQPEDLYKILVGYRRDMDANNTTINDLSATAIDQCRAFNNRVAHLLMGEVSELDSSGGTAAFNQATAVSVVKSIHICVENKMSIGEFFSLIASSLNCVTSSLRSPDEPSYFSLPEEDKLELIHSISFMLLGISGLTEDVYVMDDQIYTTNKDHRYIQYTTENSMPIKFGHKLQIWKVSSLSLSMEDVKVWRILESPSKYGNKINVSPFYMPVAPRVVN
jgi:hypothetical protein